MMEQELPEDDEDQGTRLLEKWLPLLNGKKRAYLKGAAEALIYAQEGNTEPSRIDTKIKGKKIL